MKKNKQEIELICLTCGCAATEHNKMNQKGWNRLSKQLTGYEDTPENREKFWKKFLTDGAKINSINMEEWACGSCYCDSFKLNNLDYLEKKHKEETNGI